MDKIYKIYNSVVKEVEGKPRTLEFRITTETKDRMGECVKADGCVADNYAKNPVVLFAHDYHALPIGRATEIRHESGGISAQVQFPTKEEYEFADTVYRLAKGGYLNATSVGFIPLEHAWFDENGKPDPKSREHYWEDDWTLWHTKWELLEFSVVPVPANPDALITARNAGVISVKEFQIAHKAFNVKVEPKPEAKTSQNEIRDEIDYLLSLCKTNTLNEENQTIAKELTKELKRLTGSDIPVTITLQAEEKPAETVKEITTEEATAIIQAAINEWRQSHND